MPVRITTGGKDTVVQPESVQRLARVLAILQRDVHLIDRLEAGHATSYNDALAILEFVIAKARPRDQ